MKFSLRFWHYDREKRILYLPLFSLCIIKIVLKPKPYNPICPVCNFNFEPHNYCPNNHSKMGYKGA